MQAVKNRFSFEDSLRFVSKAKESSEKSGPRAALYKGEMGKSQKRAQKMQASGNADTTYRAPAHNISLSFITEKVKSLSRFTKVLSCIAAAILISVVFLYAPAKGYYTQMRDTQKLQVEYEAILSRNDQLKTEVANLETPEGIESQATQELGLVKEGEGSALVSGIQDSEPASSKLIKYVNSSEIKAPSTWYSDFCDVLFGYVN